MKGRKPHFRWASNEALRRISAWAFVKTNCDEGSEIFATLAVVPRLTAMKVVKSLPLSLWYEDRCRITRPKSAASYGAETDSCSRENARSKKSIRKQIHNIQL